MEQQRAAGLAEQQATQFVEYDQVHAHQAHGNAPGTSPAFFLLQSIDQIDRGVGAHALGVPGQSRDAQRRGLIGLAGARTTNQHHVVRILRERQVFKFADQRSEVGSVSITGKVWDALASMIKLEDKVKSQSDDMKGQQTKIENLTERVIRLEAQLEMLMRAAEIKRIQN